MKMRILLLIACLALFALPAAAQQRLTVGIDQGTQTEWTTIASATSVARAALAGLALQFDVPFSSSARTITVVLESSPGRSSASTASALAALGVSLSRSAIETTPTLVKATVSLSQLPDLAGQLTGVAFIRPPYTPFPLATTGQGVAAIGANAFHASGFDGSGDRIAIIDLGFAGLSQAQGRGPRPHGDEPDVLSVRPDDREDPARDWQFDERAFDDDIHSVAAYLLERSGWSSYLFFETQEGGLLSDGIRLLVYDNYRHGNALKWDGDVYRDGEWINVFDGQIEESEWRQIPFDEGTVTEARIRAYLTRSGDIAAYIQKVDFHDATVPSP